ncbi:hypothetical protein TRFO_40250 [Tritrichomonas foetus]|uniref:Uncharacterized protein n=1 Tax=Tritrichomonas foetus TaxID=1144522 RepID=A0A1J4J7T5_9EUKA|nr:hypothetical protein TRFO_40250 [Tritrichomonas foetus]|eukprot:OHS93477.1 hypothetical protein TRFO_40250 [Tritrichomonas foetus]
MYSFDFFFVCNFIPEQAINTIFSGVNSILESSLLLQSLTSFCPFMIAFSDELTLKLLVSESVVVSLSLKPSFETKWFKSVFSVYCETSGISVLNAYSPLSLLIKVPKIVTLSWNNDTPALILEPLFGTSVVTTKLCGLMVMLVRLYLSAVLLGSLLGSHIFILLDCILIALLE